MKIKSVYCYFLIIFSTLLLINFVGCKEIFENKTMIDGIKFRANSVKTYISGKVSSGIIAQNQEIQGVKFKEGTEVEFYENGKLSSGTLAEDTEIQGMKFKAGTGVGFHENGKLSNGALAEDREIQGVKFKAGTGVKFYGNGKLSSGTLAENKEIQGVKYKAGTMVQFHENGKFYYGTISEDQEIQRVKFKAQTIVSFYEKGELSSETLESKQEKKKGILLLNNDCGYGCCCYQDWRVPNDAILNQQIDWLKFIFNFRFSHSQILLEEVSFMDITGSCKKITVQEMEKELSGKEFLAWAGLDLVNVLKDYVSIVKELEIFWKSGKKLNNFEIGENREGAKSTTGKLYWKFREIGDNILNLLKKKFKVYFDEDCSCC